MTARNPARVLLADTIRDRIAEELVFSGQVPAGGLLPPEGRLAELYGVSRITVRASIRSLQDAGLVRVRNGIGATVLPLRRTVTHGFDRLVSLETFGREAGKTVATRDVAWYREPADAVTAERLACSVGAPIARVERVKTVDGAAAAWFVDTVPEAVLGADVLQAEFDGAVIDVLLDHSELDVAYEDADLIPVCLEADIATRLETTAGAPALYVDAVTFSLDGEPLEWARFWLLPDHFRFAVRRRPQPRWTPSP
ncbi:MAG TPA: GntR family transcriptional regulator [Solirubrobacteraceae bacterium]|nr:GntR family transcriptional regulator [Solirubrobacteraceae bacterium]